MKKVYNLIGIAQRAGKISSGQEAVWVSLVKQRACLLLMSEDIAENSKKILVRCCERKGVPWMVLGDRHELGRSIGKADRVALTIDDVGIASAILKALEAAGREVISVGVVEWPK